eukprot:CAMPEP_0114370152 /NCGR_PEP_ID=MMETSP0101-20121206/32272_1 /TAXON_ID=38822 ORGANISM="Pteridomonas danica, Strain PT" /NCGR_SAMPLE_ID=MMETSP0101 /ASSEMBLY_ACC=CAM_ASM_000211 /LENGTH=87 /DNA_ID=CAMNT_0001521491 /DNA_START=243 /DNA_END=507 /DNA_ORIENTATION=-
MNLGPPGLSVKPTIDPDPPLISDGFDEWKDDRKDGYKGLNQYYLLWVVAGEETDLELVVVSFVDLVALVALVVLVDLVVTVNLSELG